MLRGKRPYYAHLTGKRILWPNQWLHGDKTLAGYRLDNCLSMPKYKSVSSLQHFRQYRFSRGSAFVRNREQMPQQRTLEMPFSGKLQTETKPIPMKLQPQKPNTKPIFILPRKYQYSTKFYIDRIQNTDKIPRKHQKFRAGIPNTDLVLVFSWYTNFWVSDWHH